MVPIFYTCFRDQLYWDYNPLTITYPNSSATSKVTHPTEHFGNHRALIFIILPVRRAVSWHPHLKIILKACDDYKASCMFSPTVTFFKSTANMVVRIFIMKAAPKPHSSLRRKSWDNFYVFPVNPSSAVQFDSDESKQHFPFCLMKLYTSLVSLC